MTLSTNSFDEFHCQAAYNFWHKRRKWIIKIFLSQNLEYLRIPSAIKWRETVYSYSGSGRSSSSCIHSPGPWAKAAPILFLRTVSTCFLRLKARVAQISISRTFRLLARLHLTVDSCTQWPGVQTVAKPVPPPSPDLNRRAAADESETCWSEELCVWAQTPFPRQNKAKTRLSRGFTSITCIDKKREQFTSAWDREPSVQNIWNFKKSSKKAKSLLPLCNGRVSVY